MEAGWWAPCAVFLLGGFWLWMDLVQSLRVSHCGGPVSP